MTTRKIGLVEVPPLAFGTNVLGWTVDENTGFALLDQLLAEGLNFFDTADIYSNWAPGNVGGESETLIGKWLKARGGRDKVIIASKVGMALSETKKGLSETYILQAVEASLKRLQTDYIDLYQSHKDDAQTPVEETLGAFDKLIRQGKVRMIGASNFSAARLSESLDTSRARHLPAYQSLQPHYNLFHREDYEKNLEAVCRQHKLAVLPYFALASGFLTGKYRSARDFSKSPRGGSMQQFFTTRGFRILQALDQASEKHVATPAQVALAWLMARPGITAAIASATSKQQVNELISATRLVLGSEDLADLTTASSHTQDIQG